MFIRRVKKQRSKNSRTFYQYTLAQAARIDGKVKQRSILYLGSEELMHDRSNRDIVLQLLKNKIQGTNDLFANDEKPDSRLIDLADHYYKKYLIKYDLDVDNDLDSPREVLPHSMPPRADKADYESVDLKGVRVEDSRNFGAENLCKHAADQLRLQDIFSQVGLTGQQSALALISIISRAIYAASEHRTASILDLNSSIKTLYGYDKPIGHKQLYSIADQLYGRRHLIDRALYKRLTDLFSLEDKLVIFDISNTYFETSKKGSRLAKYGRSKEKRYDCPLVTFTGVINAEGFIRHSRIYEGNKADCATMERMLDDLDSHSPLHSAKTVVIDAGIATEDNLQLIRDRGYHYVAVSRKRLKDYPADMAEHKIERQTGPNDKYKVELAAFRPEGYKDTWMYVQSEQKRVKEQSMSLKLTQRFVQDLKQIQAALTKKGGTKKLEKVWERIGRTKEKHKNVSARYNIDLEHNDEGVVTGMSWKQKPRRTTAKDKEKGVYFVRTSHARTEASQLWDIYNTIREVESTFRCLKSELKIRPVFHQKDERIQSHIYLTILAYQLVNTIRHQLRQQHIYHDWSNIVRIMSTQRMQDVVLSTPTKQLYLLTTSQPIKEVQEIYHATNCPSMRPTTKKYVVYH